MRLRDRPLILTANRRTYTLRPQRPPLWKRLLAVLWRLLTGLR